METNEYTMTVLSASEGCMLTQAEAVEPGARILTPKVYLAVNDTPEQWREVCGDELAALSAEIEAAKEAEYARMREDSMRTTKP